LPPAPVFIERLPSDQLRTVYRTFDGRARALASL
jgi:hypothetical protein